MRAAPNLAFAKGGKANSRQRRSIKGEGQGDSSKRGYLAVINVGSSAVPYVVEYVYMRFAIKKQRGGSHDGAMLEKVGS